MLIPIRIRRQSVVGMVGLWVQTAKGKFPNLKRGEIVLNIEGDGPEIITVQWYREKGRVRHERRRYDLSEILAQADFRLYENEAALQEAVDGRAP